MACLKLVAEKKFQTNEMLDRECLLLAHNLGIDPPAPQPQPVATQPELRDLRNIESILDFVRRVKISVAELPKRARAKA